MHPGDQHLPHNDRSGQPNPYSPPNPHTLSRATAQEIASLQARLDRQLGPEYISERPGAAGARVQYLEAWKCINLANEIFGFNGWSSSIQNISVDYMDDNRDTGKISLGLSVVVRVTLKDGVYHEDIGYGSIENAKSKAAAFEKCKKEGTTDALKRALRNFGNVLGNCLYDKTYLREVSKIKLPPPRLDVERLHRRPEYALPVKQIKEPEITKPSVPNPPNVQTKANVQEPFQDSFDDNYFDDYDFEDRPDIGESPRIDEFDANTLPVITPPVAGVVSAVNGPARNQLPAPQQTAANPRPAPHVTSAGSHNDQTNKTSMPSAKPIPPPPHTESTSEAVYANHSIPSAVAFSRLSRDGTPVAPFNPQTGNFSPLTGNKSDKVDYNKSAPVYRNNVQQTKTPFDKSDAQNRMPPAPAGGSGPGNRMVGCPPGQSAYNHSLHARVNSGPSMLSAKRSAPGQYVNGDTGRTSNQLEQSGDSGIKRAKYSVNH